VLVHDARAGGDAPGRLVATAEDAGVPVVEVTEFPADPDESFLAWQVAQLSALTDALAEPS
jgi:zinc/manganese transport system substrate-binding protein